MSNLARRLLDRLADASILFSFDRTGFERHRRSFRPGDLDVDLAGRRILITGANSGLGRSAAHTLAGLGAEVAAHPARGRRHHRLARRLRADRRRDRQAVVRPPGSADPPDESTRERPADRQRLWELCRHQAGLDGPLTTRP